MTQEYDSMLGNTTLQHASVFCRLAILHLNRGNEGRESGHSSTEGAKRLLPPQKKSHATHAIHRQRSNDGTSARSAKNCRPKTANMKMKIRPISCVRPSISTTPHQCASRINVGASGQGAKQERRCRSAQDARAQPQPSFGRNSPHSMISIKEKALKQ
jgi:hypothetical protein